MHENTFTNAKIGFLGSVRGGDDVGHDVFKIDPARPAGLHHDFFATGTGTPAILILNEPRLARVQK
jgi:hypothetical protein